MKSTLFICLFLSSYALAQIATPTPTGAPSTPAPTGQPTGQPTSAPTSAPTNAPTSAPTQQPTPSPTSAPGSADCSGLGFSCSDLRQALINANQQDNGGIGLPVWISAVNRAGQTCCVEFSGVNVTSQWLTSRFPAAVKAFTANGVSIDQLALSTANLFTLNQPGNFWFGNQGINPPRVDLAWSNPNAIGTAQDPLIGSVVGGYAINGGGLALYKCSGSAQVVGAIGVDGDTACADHSIAWRVRNILGLDFVPSGVHSSSNSTSSNASDDNIIYASDNASSGFAHAQCSGSDTDVTVRNNLPAVRACGSAQ